MIYFLEDDNNIRELVVYTLNSTVQEAKGFEKPSLFWEAMEQQIPDLILLDIMLPEEDGLQVLAKLRNMPATQHIPVMMLTAKGSEYDKVVGLDRGADDYLAKPFGMMELSARVRALLRRSSMDGNHTEYQIGQLYVDPAKHIVKADGVDILLTLKEFELLCFLLKHQGFVLNRDQILNEIWGYEFDGESRTVDVHIRTLRQKLGQCGNYIETIRGFGYKIGGELV